MSRRLPMLLLALCALVLCVTPVYASEASDAYKQAKTLAKDVQRADTEEAAADAQAALESFVRTKATSLLRQDLSKGDTAYVGRMQSVAGMHAEAVATFEKALAHPGETKYLSTLYLSYLRALLDNGQYDKGLETFNHMAKTFADDTNLKHAGMSLGLAMRTQKRWNDSVVGLDASLKMKNGAALKPLVNSLLLAKRKDDAIARIEWAIEAAGEKGKSDAHPILLEITKKWGQELPLEFTAFVPGEAPDLTDKVVVMGFWNASAMSLGWTMETLQSLFDEFPPAKGVETLAVTTYYQKNPDTGKFEDDMTPEAEHAIGASFREYHGFEGKLAYVANREALQALGVSAFPTITIVDRDGKLIYSHTINRQDPAELEVIREIIKKAMP